MKPVVLTFVLAIALVVLIALGGLLFLWTRGLNTAFLPGLGIVVAIPFLVVIAAFVEIILIVSAIILWRS